MTICKNHKTGLHAFIDHICYHCGLEEAFCRENEFSLNLDEARALNSLLRLHHGLFREMPEYIHLLRLINGLGTFLDQHDK